jgi:hypothetical protein
MLLLTANDFARLFKLPACINNERFARQVKIIQDNAIASVSIPKPNSFMHNTVSKKIKKIKVDTSYYF